MIENISSPKDLKNLSDAELEVLAAELRAVILDTVSKTGGHLGSNLGFVEATIVLHKLFDVPRDSLLFDVGHQCYAHKLLTGRYRDFASLRSYGGISGFPNRAESEYDTLTAGHSGSSVSAALGIATANALAGSDAYTVAIVGDGSFTNGMIYEALNNCGNKNIRLLIILNDNEMSISENVGSFAGYLSKIRTSGRYYKFKRRFQKVIGRIPVIGKGVISLTRHIKNALKRVFYKQPFFSPLGVKYFGPVDGNDIERLTTVIAEAKKSGECALVHIKTQKGRGYEKAEKDPQSYHGVSPFDPAVGVSPCAKNDFSAAFGAYVCEKAACDDRLVAVTAAMCAGTGLTDYALRFPERFFDVGIAEEHAVAFSGGLAAKGFLPVCAIYSTFAQRTYDQILHDAALQNLHMVLALDRAGFVPGDGETHQGIFDAAFLSTIPHTELFAPVTFDELRRTLDRALCSDKVSAVRYPKGGEADLSGFAFIDEADYAIGGDEAPDVLFVTYGTAVTNVIAAAKALQAEGKRAAILRLIKLHPFSDALKSALIGKAKEAKAVLIVEEGVKSGGIGEKVEALLCEAGVDRSVRSIAIDEAFPPHGSVEQLRKRYGFDAASLIESAEALLR